MDFVAAQTFYGGQKPQGNNLSMVTHPNLTSDIHVKSMVGIGRSGSYGKHSIQGVINPVLNNGNRP